MSRKHTQLSHFYTILNCKREKDGAGNAMLKTTKCQSLRCPHFPNPVSLLFSNEKE